MARWRAVHDDGLAPRPTAEEVGDERGPIARLLTPERMTPRSDRDDAVRTVAGDAPEEVEHEIQAAERLMQDGRLAEAESAFKRIDRRRQHGTFARMLGKGKRDSAGAQARVGKLGQGSDSWGEKALFGLAEAQYRQGKLVDANDSIVKLLTDFPGSAHLDQAVRREYEIALTWLDAVDPKAPPERRGKIEDRFNRRMPPFDVAGNALQVLEHVRHHDPDGPLADDAALKIADYHYAHGNYEEAAIVYDQLITDHPKSELLQTAYMRTIDAKLKAYIGPDYDASMLEKAREQAHQALALFPERQASTTEELSHTLDLIEDQQAEITYRRGEFYRQTGYPGAAEHYFGEVRARWPESAWAKKARAELDQIAKLPRKKVEPSRIMTRPGSNDPYANGLSSAGAAGASPLAAPGMTGP
jgi:outer membrane protein assembly factor BamD (BamD/ComL family)